MKTSVDLVEAVDRLRVQIKWSSIATTIALIAIVMALSSCATTKPVLDCANSQGEWDVWNYRAEICYTQHPDTCLCAGKEPK